MNFIKNNLKAEDTNAMNFIKNMYQPECLRYKCYEFLYQPECLRYKCYKFYKIHVPT